MDINQKAPGQDDGSWFESWLVIHRAACNASGLKMTVVERYPGLPMRSIVSCAECQTFGSGSVQDVDLGLLTELIRA
jgi:hypothetical protein